jgi:uncharacterized protein (TIRG00374 family)
MAKRRLLIALGFAVSFLFLGLAFQGLDWQAFFRSLAHINLMLLPFVVLLHFIVITLQAWRERIILRPFGDVPLKDLRDIQIMGAMGNNIYPFSGGEALRMYLLRSQHQIPIPTATTNMLIIRVVDGLTLLALLLFALTTNHIPSRWFMDITFVATPLFLGALGMFITFTMKPNLLRRFVARLCHLLPERFHATLIHIEEQVILSLSVLRDPQVMFGVIGLTAISRLIEATGYWLVLSAFGMDGGYGIAVLVVCVVSLAGVVSASPGQIGVTHFAIVMVLTTLRIDRDMALAFAIVAHMLMFIPVTLAGAILLARQGMSLRNFDSAHITQTQEIRKEIDYVEHHKDTLNPYVTQDIPELPSSIKPGDVLS